MITVYLNREKETMQGTEGVLSVPALSFSCFCLELPWRNNRVSISCIPEGEYECVRYFSNAFSQWLYKVQNVEGRTGIAIHSGNVAGAEDKGYKTHSLGCILLGKRRGKLWKQDAVLVSRITVNKFFRLFEEKPFELKITGGNQ